jgi:hypothetical protein
MALSSISALALGGIGGRGSISIFRHTESMKALLSISLLALASCSSLGPMVIETEFGRVERSPDGSVVLIPHLEPLIVKGK